MAIKDLEKLLGDQKHGEREQIADDIIDLKLHDKHLFQSDRSVENSLGIIIRTQ